MKKNKYIGSSFESFLEEEGIFEEVNAAAIKAVIARNLQEYMNKININLVSMPTSAKDARKSLKSNPGTGAG